MVESLYSNKQIITSNKKPITMAEKTEILDNTQFDETVRNNEETVKNDETQKLDTTTPPPAPAGETTVRNSPRRGAKKGMSRGRVAALGAVGVIAGVAGAAGINAYSHSPRMTEQDVAIPTAEPVDGDSDSTDVQGGEIVDSEIIGTAASATDSAMFAGSGMIAEAEIVESNSIYSNMRHAAHAAGMTEGNDDDVVISGIEISGQDFDANGIYHAATGVLAGSTGLGEAQSMNFGQADMAFVGQAVNAASQAYYQNVDPANISSQSDNMEVPSMDEITVATAPSDDMCFNEAFAAARAQVGSNGVFTWRGGVYGTYYADEWNALPESYRAEFTNHDWSEPLLAAGAIGEEPVPAEPAGPVMSQPMYDSHGNAYVIMANAITGEPMQVWLDGDLQPVLDCRGEVVAMVDSSAVAEAESTGGELAVNYDGETLVTSDAEKTLVDESVEYEYIAEAEAADYVDDVVMLDSDDSMVAEIAEIDYDAEELVAEADYEMPEVGQIDLDMDMEMTDDMMMDDIDIQ